MSRLVRARPKRLTGCGVVDRDGNEWATSLRLGFLFEGQFVDVDSDGDADGYRTHHKWPPVSIDIRLGHPYGDGEQRISTRWLRVLGNESEPCVRGNEPGNK